MKKQPTLVESTNDLLSPEEVALILGIKPQSLRAQIKQDSSVLGFPVIRIGTRSYIPRVPFLRVLKG